MNRKEHSIKNAKEIDYERTTGMIKMQASYIDFEHPSDESGPLPRNYRMEVMEEGILIQKYEEGSWKVIEMQESGDIKKIGKYLRRIAGMPEISQTTVAKNVKWANQLNAWLARYIEEQRHFPLFPGMDVYILFAFYDASWQEMAIFTSGVIQHCPTIRSMEPIFEMAAISDY